MQVGEAVVTGWLFFRYVVIGGNFYFFIEYLRPSVSYVLCVGNGLVKVGSPGVNDLLGVLCVLLSTQSCGWTFNIKTLILWLERGS